MQSISEIRFRTEKILITIKPKHRAHDYLRAIDFVTKPVRKRLFLIVVVQLAIGVLDLIGVGLVGLIISISVQNKNSETSLEFLNSALEIVNLSDLQKESLIIFLCVVSTVILIGRTFFSLFFTRKILFFFGKRGAEITKDLFSRMMKLSLNFLISRNAQELVFGVTRGVELITLSVVGISVVLLADISMLAIMFLAFLFVDSSTTISAFLLFGLIGFILHRILNKRSGYLGSRNSELDIKSNEKVVEALSHFRVILTKSRFQYYENELAKMRNEFSKTSAQLTFLPFISKYILETSVVVGALLITTISLFVGNSTQALSTLGILIAASARIVPAILRIQQGAMQIKISLGRAKPTLLLQEAIMYEETLATSKDVEQQREVHGSFNPTITLDNVTYSYSFPNRPAVSKFSLAVTAGEFIGIVGSSGSGKSTLADLILGIAEPQFGEVRISDLPPKLAASIWPNSIGYVPQTVYIGNFSIRENICLGYPAEFMTDEQIMSVANLSKLDQVIQEMPQGLDTLIGENGFGLSGGQKQRLGITRALLTSPKLLVLDESTSGLDSEMEAELMRPIVDLKGQVTLVVIAHRLSTIRNADRVVFLEDGVPKAIGSFEEVKLESKEFRRQAELLGL